jgi:hypothetical protein
MIPHVCIHMRMSMLLSSLWLVVLPSCCSMKLTQANQEYWNDETEISDDSKAEGYLASSGLKEDTFRFRKLLHEKGKARIVEITIQKNRQKSGIARIKEVSLPFDPGNRELYSIRVIQKKEAFNFHFRESMGSREWIIGKQGKNPRLFMAEKGKEYANHMLFPEFERSHRNGFLPAVRNLGYVATVPCDLITLPPLFFWYTGMIAQ